MCNNEKGKTKFFITFLELEKAYDIMDREDEWQILESHVVGSLRAIRFTLGEGSIFRVLS